MNWIKRKKEDIEHESNYLSWKNPHDGESRHIENKTSSSFQLFSIDLASTADNISGPTAGLHYDWRCGSINISVHISAETKVQETVYKGNT